MTGGESQTAFLCQVRRPRLHIEQLSALRQTEGVGGWACYVPSYAYQFIRGDKVVFEITVSWRCEAVQFKVDGNFSLAICDTSSPAAKKLLELTEANLKKDIQITIM